MTRSLLTGLAAALILLLAAGVGLAESNECPAGGHWRTPADSLPRTTVQLLDAFAGRRILLLGERHDSAEHHRWQLYALAALHGRRTDLVVGFEMFPRSVQPALERWRHGELGDEAFLEAARWSEVWGFPADLYFPLFHFVRQNRLPTVALNVERALVSEVGRVGWAAVHEDKREGVGRPAAASEAYRRSLAEVFLGHSIPAPDTDVPDREGDTSVDEVLARDDFGRFVEAQLTWDRAMAEALAEAARVAPRALVVGIIGSGHLHYRWGVAHQLVDLGIPDEEIAVLLPLDTAAACKTLEPGLADAVFLLDPRPEPAAVAERPRLGVMIEPSEAGVLVRQVVPDSIAAATGIRADDVIVSAAGQKLGRTADLVAVIERQAPGTWLPLAVLRAGESLELLAKFPAGTVGAE